MRYLSRRGFFTALAGLGSATAVVARSFNAAAAAAETTLGPLTPWLRKGCVVDAGLDYDQISGRVTRFDPALGYGFVTPDNAGPDILLHVTCLRAGGYQTAREGTRIVCYVLQRPEGAQVYRIVHMDESTASGASLSPLLKHVPVKPESGWEQATVKWFNRVRGFGFLTREEGSPDIFVHLETVQQCALAELRPGQVVDIRWGIGLKGLTVATMRPHWPLGTGTII